MSLTTSKCSNHGMKSLFLIIAMSSLVKVTRSIKFPGLGGGRGHDSRHAIDQPDIIHGKDYEYEEDVDKVHGETGRRASISVEKHLTSVLINRYNTVGKVGRPVSHTNDVMHIRFGLILVQIMEVDEFHQILKLSLWSRFEWTDFVLRWTPSDYDNIQTLRLPSARIWLPDIRLYNFADERLTSQRDALAVVHSNGTVQWEPQALMKSSCDIDTKYFPFDIQRCHLKFGSWSYSVDKLDLDFMFKKAIVLENYIENNEWIIISNRASRRFTKYDCCAEQFCDITFELHLKRRTQFYTLILILPCILLSIPTLVIFWVPPESPVKLQLGMNVFIAFFFLLMVLSGIVPRAAPTTPIIGAYFCLNMVMIALSTLLACIVTNMYYRGVRTKRAPKWLRSAIGGRIAKFFELDTAPLISDEKSTSSCKESSDCEIAVVPEPFHDNDMHSMNDQDSNCIQYKQNPHNHLEEKHEEEEQQQQQQQQQSGNNFDSVVDGDQVLNIISSRTILLQEVRAIRCWLDCYELSSQLKEEKSKVLKEWQVLASIADRFFFIAFISINIVGILFIMILL